jgi:hypothetical protein
MQINRSHLLIFSLATLVAIVVLAIVPGVGTQGDLGGRLGLIDALTGLLLIEGGAIAGASPAVSQ